jgi:hypothetical protein
MPRRGHARTVRVTETGRKTTAMFRIVLRQGGTESSESHEGPDYAARERAIDWCRGWEVRTQVSVLAADGSPVFVAANNDRDYGNVSSAGIPSRLVK